MAKQTKQILEELGEKLKTFGSNGQVKEDCITANDIGLQYGLSLSEAYSVLEELVKKRPKGEHLVVQYAVGALDEGSVEEHIPLHRLTIVDEASLEETKASIPNAFARVFSLKAPTERQKVKTEAEEEEELLKAKAEGRGRGRKKGPTSMLSFLRFFEHFEPTEEGVQKLQSLNSGEARTFHLNIRPVYREGVMKEKSSQSSSSSSSSSSKPPLETITSTAVNCDVDKKKKVKEEPMEVEVPQQKKKSTTTAAAPSKRASSSDGCCKSKKRTRVIQIPSSDEEEEGDDDKVVVQFDSGDEDGGEVKKEEEEEENKPKREKVETTMEVDDGEFMVTKLSDKTLEAGGKKKAEVEKEIKKEAAAPKSSKPSAGKSSSQKAVPKNQTSIMSFFKKAPPNTLHALLSGHFPAGPRHDRSLSSAWSTTTIAAVQDNGRALSAAAVERFRVNQRENLALARISPVEFSLSFRCFPAFHLAPVRFCSEAFSCRHHSSVVCWTLARPHIGCSQFSQQQVPWQLAIFSAQLLQLVK
ncbi:hypothetical protein TYRP_009310 [Tyrophagus putrescentiae]|nr:hypothetical protein TYRP_009310 [Tyrophagus putrescentiae]